MARNVLLSDVLSRARVHADQRDASFIDDTEGLALLNEAFAELYDDLVDIDENYYTSTSTIAVVTGTTNYALPADFYKIIGVDYASSLTGQRVTLYRFNEAERNLAFTQSSNIPNGYLFITYVPAPPIFSALTETVDGISGWDRLLSLRVAIDMMDAEESNSDRLMLKYQQRLETMKGSLSRDIGMPATISDVTRPSVQYLYSSLKYRLYGQNIRLVSTEWIGDAGFSGGFL